MSRLRESAVASVDSDVSQALDVRVTFTASGPFGLRVRGRGKELRWLTEGKNLVFSVPLPGIKTGISMRDGAMHDLLGTRRHPTVELRVPRAAVTLPTGKACVEGEVEGRLTLRGKSAPISVAYELKRSGDKLGVTGSMRVPVDVWGIALPQHMGFGLKSLVAVKVVFSVLAADLG